MSIIRLLLRLLPVAPIAAGSMFSLGLFIDTNTHDTKEEVRTVNLKDKYAIVGVGYTPQGQIPERTTMSFHLEACANAIEDAGLRREDIDGLIIYRHFVQPTGEGALTPYLLAQHLGLAPTYLTQDAN